jgi:hypothetical protein
MPRSYTLSALLLCVGFLGCGRAETASYPVDGLAGGKEIARTVPSTIPEPARKVPSTTAWSLVSV